ncbi:MAG TPA: hypothetical protein VJM83_04395, partial [Nitrospirota bacterium]|nr:hypothetical protein [Nitrospirota bacterium]
YGPLMPLHSMTSTITSVLVFPGEDVVGEGIVMELRGLIVDARDSLREKEIMLSEETNEGTMRDGKIIVPFYMRMLCGCRIYPGGKFGILWEAERFKITTQAYYKGKLYYEDVTTADKQAQEASLFETSVPLPKDLPEGGFGKERVKVRIMAAQNDMNNFGMDEFNVYLSK